MKFETFFEKFELFTEAPDAVPRMRELVLELAIQGKLVEQDSDEVPAADSLRNCTKAVRPLELRAAKVPHGWASIPLGCVIASNTGGGTPAKQNLAYWNGPIPWASVKDIQSNKYLTTTIDSITQDGLKKSSSNLIPTNRLIVVTRMGLGKLAINKIPVAINQDLRAIEPNEALDLDFAYLLFKALKLVGKGVTVKGVTVDVLHSIPVALPPVAEQGRIVAKVDELVALCDRLEAQQQERETHQAALARAALARFAEAPTPANLDFLFHKSYAITPADLRKIILTLAVQGKLVPQDPNDEPGETLLQRILLDESGRKLGKSTMLGVGVDDLPFDLRGGWSAARLGSILESKRGISYGVIKLGPEPQQGGVYVLRCSNVRFRKIDLSGVRKVTEDLSSEYGRTILEGGEVLINVRGTLGGCAVVPESMKGFNIAREVAVVPVHSGIDATFLMNVVASPYFQDKVSEGLRGIAYEGLNLNSLREFLVPIPPLAEQRRIVAKVDQLTALVDQLEAHLAASRAVGEELMKALVAELTAQSNGVASQIPQAADHVAARTAFKNQAQPCADAT